MTKDDITRMARQAGFVGFDGENKCLREFATLVRADEREACAKVCEANVWSKPVAWWREATKSDVSVEAGLQCATAVRARGQG